MSDLDRRTVLKSGAAATAGAAALAGPFAGYLAAPAVADGRRHGPGLAARNALRPVADLRDGVERLQLPEGFRYRSFQESSRAVPLILDDGARLPGRHDGMGAFAAHGPHHDDHQGDGDDDDNHDGLHPGVVLVRNHEENGSATGGAPVGTGTPVYDSAALGGTSTTHVSLDGVVHRSYMSLAGTQMNCSGGRMPWGSWVTCEETVNGVDVGDDFTRTPRGGTDPGPLTYRTNALLTQRHGYVFEVPAHGTASAAPIRSAGRFAHEAVAFDPRGGSLYLTEDNFAFPSGFYRYDPPADPMRVGRLHDGGRLWMLKVAGQDQADLARSLPDGSVFAVEWVEIAAPDVDYGAPVAGVPNGSNDQALNHVGGQGRARGAARFSRLEGAVYDHGWVFWSSTQGGGAPEPGPSDSVGGWGNGNGQIWGLDLRGQTLHMLYQSPGPEILDFPDNVTTSRRGTLVLCEDGTNENYVRGLTRRGRLFDIAKNNLPLQPPAPAPSVPDRNDEFAGSTFSPDGRTLFVNIQDTVGMTFAIWGPWGRIDV